MYAVLLDEPKYALSNACDKLSEAVEHRNQVGGVVVELVPVKIHHETKFLTGQTDFL